METATPAEPSRDEARNRELYANFCAGSTPAFDQLYGFWWPKLRRWFTGRGVGNDAEDLADDVMIRVLQSKGAAEYVPGYGPFEGWVRILAKHRMVEWIGKNRARYEWQTAIYSPGEPVVLPDEELLVWFDGVEQQATLMPNTVDGLYAALSDRHGLRVQRKEMKRPRAGIRLDVAVFGTHRIELVCYARQRSRSLLKIHAMQPDQAELVPLGGGPADDEGPARDVAAPRRVLDIDTLVPGLSGVEIGAAARSALDVLSRNILGEETLLDIARSMGLKGASSAHAKKAEGERIFRSAVSELFGGNIAPDLEYPVLAATLRVLRLHWEL